jgi:predicted DNA-binding protein (MmcQ/YjbR family)
MFACFGHAENRAENIETVSVKCADVESAEMLIDAGVAQTAKYFHRSWVTLALERLEPGEAEHRVAVSYDTVALKLPKKVREGL